MSYSGAFTLKVMDNMMVGLKGEDKVGADYKLRVQGIKRAWHKEIRLIPQIEKYSPLYFNILLIIISSYIISTMKPKLNLSEPMSSATNEDEPKLRKKNKTDNINFLTGKEYSDRYYEILDARRKLPAFESKHKLIGLL